MYCYELKHISKRYGKREVLRIEHLAIREGTMFALLGPSGAGKSTLLRLLNFLEPPTSGELWYENQRFDSQPPLAIQRTVTTVFQKPALLNSSVWHNVAYGLRVRGQYETEIVKEALEAVQVTHLAKANATTLSGGEAQRVALARALVIKPKVLLLDEPTANLDPANVALIERIIKRLQATSTTIVIVTHNLFQARRLADDAALLINGELVESGPIQQLFDAPHDARTRAFMGGTMVW